MNKIREIRTALGYTQERFASVLHVSRATVAMWETGKSDPGYETIRLISTLYNISADFIIGNGVFSCWDEIVTYFDSVNYALDQIIPPDLMMPTFCEDKYLTAWLDQTLYENDELQVARWFAFAVKKIDILPNENVPDGVRSAKVDIEFTPEFNALIIAHLKHSKKDSFHHKRLTMQDGLESFFRQHKNMDTTEVAQSENAIVRAALTSPHEKIPVLGSIPAGIPIEAVEEILDWEEIPPEWVTGGRQYFGLKVKGDSMWPKYLDGDTVILLKESSCDSGDDCAVLVNGDSATLKQVFMHDDGSMEIRPLNPSYPPRTFSPSEIQSLPVAIAGVVVELRRKIK